MIHRDPLSQVNGSLVSRWRKEDALLEDQGGMYDRCLRQVVHRADMLLTVQGLSSGKARDVDGQVGRLLHAWAGSSFLPSLPLTPLLTPSS